MNWIASIHHDGSPRYVAPSNGRATLRLRADIHAPIEKILIRSAPDGEQSMTPMERVADEGVCQWWQAELPRAMPRDGYRFYIITAEGDFWLSAAGVTRHTPTDTTDFKLLDSATMPAWVRNAVFYQIFPDRFCDGDPSNNVRDGEYTYLRRPVIARGWDATPTRELGPLEFFGGDIQGIIQKLGYLQDLGVTAIYLTPVFTSPSNHKYDSATYEEVDPHFGGNTALAELRSALDVRGMRLMLDLVPNHSGDRHTWFQAALADKDAPEAGFYTFRSHPGDYEKWLGVSTLPKLNYRSEELRERMYAGENSIVRRWMRPPYRIDAWRIDVANMLARQGDSQLGHKIGRGMRRAVKDENPQAYLLGENFFDGTPHLQGEELDASMNYRGFAFPLLQWLAGDYFLQAQWLADVRPLDTATMAAQWLAFLAPVPYQVALQQFNLLGSHDTPRVTTILGGDLAKLQVARALLYAFPGVPCIYYGDEVGLEGGTDPDNRRPMPWDESRWNAAVLDFERKLTRIRRSSPALRHGGFQLVHAHGQTVAFLREVLDERVLVVARRADDGMGALDVRAAGIADGVTCVEMLTGVESTVVGGRLPLLHMPEVGVQLWRMP
ncbi:maltodextrin glucosidase [Chloroflexia bacterium SDU3-3]|nr:maltodextrin glucosidase [Chloroflexia bacterium SDU3-3]